MASVVLGIDAAWTERQPSGVAVAVHENAGWRLAGVFGSYADFTGQTAAAAPGHLIAASARIAGRPPDIVAVDMPLSRRPITTRREGDNAVSRAFGRRKCSTHSPGPHRPGSIGRDLQNHLSISGYPLATLTVSPPCTIEVYPHPALLALTGAAERLPYKVGKRRSYWPAATGLDRLERLFTVWRSICLALDAQIGGVAAALPLPAPESSNAVLKSFEDKLDAIVCAWVGIETINGRTKPYGDADAAIWIP